jgi:DNA-binding PadR family transcriptional regulator
MKYLFLALLAAEPTHGYNLLQTYESLFAAALPPLNAGQIYTTLSRLERDGLVRDHQVEQENKPAKRVYELTKQGNQVLLDWFGQPLTGPRIKDNFYVKLLSARMTNLVDPRGLIEGQRRQYMQTLHDLNTLAVSPEVASNPTKLLLIQGAMLHLKADLEWLDLCEETLTQGV